MRGISILPLNQLQDKVIFRINDDDDDDDDDNNNNDDNVFFIFLMV